MAMLTVASALERVLAGVQPLGREDVGLRYAAGRTLAQPVAALLTNPPFNASAMDGYAVSAADCAALPVTLSVAGEARAGVSFKGRTGGGTAIRIFTGAPVPDSTDSVVIQEDIVREGERIVVREPVNTGQNIRPLGQDFKVGDALLAPGRVLTSRDVLLLAAAGHATVSVHKRPAVAILATGDELVEPGTTPGEGEIVASNAYGLSAMVTGTGGMTRLVGIAKDTRSSLAAQLLDCETADVLVTIGGASVGDHDLVRPALEEAGATLDFYKIAMRPGKPTFFGTRQVSGKLQRIIGLPGNPVSAMVSARLFLVPLIAQLLGRDDVMTHADAILAMPLTANGPREHYMRAIADFTALPIVVTPLASQDSSMVSLLARANCLIVVPIDAPAMAKGTRVKLLKLDF